MTDEKVETLEKIAPVQILKDVQYFLGFANFYRCFIQDYSKIILPMTNSTSLEKHKWQSTSEIEHAQKQLVQAFTTAPVVRHFNPKEPAIVETDASDFALGGILSQKYKGQLYLICYSSEINTHEETGKAMAKALLRSLPHNGTQLYGNTIEYVVS